VEKEWRNKETDGKDNVVISGFIYTDPPRLPAREEKRYRRYREVLGRPRIHNRLKLYLYMLHTHIHRPVKAGTTWLCLSWETILHGAHIHAVLLSTPHRLSFAGFLFRTIVLPILS